MSRADLRALRRHNSTALRTSGSLAHASAVRTGTPFLRAPRADGFASRDDVCEPGFQILGMSFLHDPPLYATRGIPAHVPLLVPPAVLSQSQGRPQRPIGATNPLRRSPLRIDTMPIHAPHYFNYAR